MSIASLPGSNYWVRSGILTLLEKGSGLVFALGTVILLSRGLSKADFATWGLFLLITYFLEMGRTGLIQNGLVRYLASNRDKPLQYVSIATASTLLNLSFSLLSNVALWLGMHWLIETYQAPHLDDVLPVYFFTNFAMAFFYHFNFVQQANLEFRGIFWATFCFRGALFVWVALCWAMGWPMVLQQLALSMLVGALTGMFGSFLYARPFLLFWKNIPAHQRAEFPRTVWVWLCKLLSFGKYVLGTNLSTMFYKSVDKLTLGSMLGPAAFAVYDIAGRITQLIEAPSFSMAAVVFPQSAQRLDRDGPSGIKWLYERSVGAILAIILPFLMLVLLFAEPIILVMAGSQYLESANILRLTAFFGLFMPFAVQFGTILDSTGRPATNFAYTLFTALLNLGLSYLFVSRFGLIGAALATLTGLAVSFVGMQRLLRRDFGIQWWRAFSHIPGFYRLAWNLVKQKSKRSADKKGEDASSSNRNVPAPQEDLLKGEDVSSKTALSRIS
jgi:lipopolysaccharide exporter